MDMIIREEIELDLIIRQTLINISDVFDLYASECIWFYGWVIFSDRFFAFIFQIVWTVVTVHRLMFDTKCIPTFAGGEDKMFKFFLAVVTFRFSHESVIINYHRFDIKFQVVSNLGAIAIVCNSCIRSFAE